MAIVMDYTYVADVGKFGTITGETIDECISELRARTGTKRLHHAGMNGFKNGKLLVYKYNKNAHYDTMPLATITRIPRPHVVNIIKCKVCDAEINAAAAKHKMCSKCYEASLEESRASIRDAYDTAVDGMTVIGCTTGVCAEVHRHRDKFIDDSQRLTSGFLLRMLCGRKVELAYLRRRESRITEKETSIADGMKLVFG